MKFRPEMNGLNTFHVLFHAGEAKNITQYNNWNFTGTYYWDSLTPDSFWYSPRTVMLFTTNTYEIGRDQMGQVTLDLEAEKYIKEQKNVTASLGILPLAFEDIVEYKVSNSIFIYLFLGNLEEIYERQPRLQNREV